MSRDRQKKTLASPNGATRSRLSVVLFNLGGPDSLKSVRPFLQNLFSDPAIIRLPWILRLPLAWLIATLRAKSAQANYALMGGASPLLGETALQANALKERLSQLMPDRDITVDIAMRYWRPMTRKVANDISRRNPDNIVLLPLYPQFSTTTTGSSFEEWRHRYRGNARVKSICCWYDEPGFVRSHANSIRKVWEEAGNPDVRLLFSAHGLPERIIAAGDPYQIQIERTCSLVVESLGGDWDWEVCYQSRVGPLRWLGPSTPEAIARAGADGVGVLIDPIAFVSDHIETVVEIDREYAEIARDVGVTPFLRAPVVGADPIFINGLADLVMASLEDEGEGHVSSGRLCPVSAEGCPRRRAGAVR